MTLHVQDWLSAYHDGELRGGRLLQVEAHLRECADCQAELQALQSLSALVQAVPASPARTPPDRFVAQVRLRLPVRNVAQASAGRRVVWAAAPLAVIGLWAFLQAVLMVSGLTLTVLARAGAGVWAQDFGVGALALLAIDAVVTAAAAALLGGWLAGGWAARGGAAPSSLSERLYTDFTESRG